MEVMIGVDPGTSGPSKAVPGRSQACGGERENAGPSQRI